MIEWGWIEPGTVVTSDEAHVSRRVTSESGDQVQPFRGCVDAESRPQIVQGTLLSTGDPSRASNEAADRPARLFHVLPQKTVPPIGDEADA